MYLIQLAERVAQGLKQISADRLARHRKFLLSQQTEGGGFKGREGDADLYYTGFAVRALAVSGGMDADCSRKVAEYLRTIDPVTLGVIDLLSWLYSAARSSSSKRNRPVGGAYAGLYPACDSQNRKQPNVRWRVCQVA